MNRPLDTWGSFSVAGHGSGSKRCSKRRQMEGRGKGRGHFPLKPLADLRSDGIVESFSNATAISRERGAEDIREREGVCHSSPVFRQTIQFLNLKISLSLPLHGMEYMRRGRKRLKPLWATAEAPPYWLTYLIHPAREPRTTKQQRRRRGLKGWQRE